MSDEPKNLTDAEMESIVNRLKAEGRLMSPEKLLEVIGKDRQEFQPNIMAARKAGASGPAKQKINS